VGKGLLLPHPGFIRIESFVEMGEGCTVLPMVLFGKKNPGDNYSIKVGDNCYFGTGVTVLGSINIGNNVTVAAGSVVLKDVPDNAIVGGIPAKIIKMKETDENR
jgi:serine O-acetyltransferase